MSDPSSPTDWQRWYARWEAQQTHHMPEREERFTAILDVLEAAADPVAHVIDLGCGPGSLAARILERLPAARVTAVDMDPVLLAIGRHAVGDFAGRLRFVDADLRSARLDELAGPADAAVSTTALHWLQSSALADLYAQLGTTIRPGGLFVNGDHLGFPPSQPILTALARRMRALRPQPAADGAEDWEAWWTAVAREPGLARELAERELRVHDHPEHDHAADLEFHVGALRRAGFAEVDTVWQHLSDRVLVAVR